MTAGTTNTDVEVKAQLTDIQGVASRLVTQLCDRSAYASDDEYEEILSLVRALRQFCGMAGPNAGR
jgi:hypothetical protein